MAASTPALSANMDAITATQLYASYGCVRYQSGTLPTSKGHTGQRSEAATSGPESATA